MKEIERKFLVRSDRYKSLAEGVLYRQGYLNSDKARVVRVRVAGSKGWITIKGAVQGVTRPEYEYEIPVAEANELLSQLCEQPLIEKVRYTLRAEDGHTWEVDAFLGANEGLQIAEIELQAEDEPFAKPDWLGAEVSGDDRYYNSSLIRAPYSTWKEG